LLYPVKIEFKEYPSGSWADWSQYLAEAPVISKKVESENEGEAGVIVFDNASVSFRYDSSNPVYSAFSIDLSSKQRYLFRISAVKTDKTYKQLFEGMADFSTIRWPDPDEGKLIAFDCVDKLSALGMLSSELTRTETTLNARVLAQTPSAFYLVADLPSATELRLYSSFDAEGNNPYYFTSPIVFPGELIRDPQSWGGSEPRYLVVLESRMITSGNVYNQVITTPRINPVTFLDPYPLASNKCTYLSKEVFGVDINNVTGEVLDNLDGLKIIEVFYKQAWSGATVILKPPALVYNVPAPYALRIQGSSPFAATTLDALKIFADSLLPAAATNYGCYIYVNNNGDLVLQTKEDLSTNGTTRSIGTTKIVSKPEKKYFWNKLVDGVTVEVKSWITDEFGDYLVGTSAQSKQIPGNTSSVKPKNEITKELLTSNATEDTQAELDARAATVASAILDFYGKRKSAFDLELNIDDNTLDWELVDNMTLDSIQCFFTQMEFDLVERVLKLEPVEITGHDYDFRQIVIGLSQANSIGYSGGGTTYIGSGGGQGGINYLFASPLLNTAGTVTLEMTGNFKITSSQLDTIQDILTTSTPTFNQVILASAGSSTQAVRADRTVLAAYPLTGGGDLTADRNLSLQFNAPLINSANYLALDLAAPMILSADKLTLDYNTTNLKLTSNKLNTIQDIAVTSSPTFTNLTLSGVITVNGTGSNYFEGRVGLGVTPQLSTKLQVEGNIFVSGGDRVILNYSNNYLGLGTNNTERMRIAAGGNVGINITSPNVALEVGGNVHVSGGDRTIFNRSNNYLAFGTNNTEAFRIKNDLNVGFGITNPVEKIHLAGHLKQDGSYSLYNNFTSGWTGSGWRVDYNITNPSESTVEADNMFLRGSLTVYELIINQIRASRGTVYITPANGRIETVTGTPPEEVITIEDPTGNGYIYFAANDIVIVQKVDLDNTTIIKRIVRKVDTVSAGNVY